MDETRPFYWAMRVRDLIEELGSYDPDSLVFIDRDGAEEPLRLDDAPFTKSERCEEEDPHNFITVIVI